MNPKPTNPKGWLRDHLNAKHDHKPKTKPGYTPKLSPELRRQLAHAAVDLGVRGLPKHIRELADERPTRRA